MEMATDTFAHMLFPEAGNEKTHMAAVTFSFSFFSFNFDEKIDRMLKTRKEVSKCGDGGVNGIFNGAFWKSGKRWKGRRHSKSYS